MKKGHFTSLWAMFTAITFIVLLITIVLMTSIAFILFHLGYLKVQQENPLGPITFLLLLSAVVGASLFLFVGKIFINPIKRFSEVSKEVAKGNFNVTIDEQSRIEEVQEMATNFNIMVQELSSIETLRSDFVTNVSHEFKTPLAAIEGYATLLQDKDMPDSERDEYTKMIIDSSRQLSTLVGNILSLSKLENHEVNLERKEFRLDEQIREAILLLESRWSEKEIDLLVDLAKVNYAGNKNLLRQVWLNLIDNAIKFSPQNGRIAINLSVADKGVIFSIVDNGIGIEQKDIDHIFVKFFQVDAARKVNGNGLGLALAKRIVDLCGGSIKVESKLGVGSKFIVSLP